MNSSPLPRPQSSARIGTRRFGRVNCIGTLTLIGAYDDLEEDLLSDGTSGAFGVYSSVPGNAAFDQCVATFNEIGVDGYASLLQPPNFTLPDGGPPTPDNSFLPPYGANNYNNYQYQKHNQKNTSFETHLTSNNNDKLQ